MPKQNPEHQPEENKTHNTIQKSTSPLSEKEKLIESPYTNIFATVLGYDVQQYPQTINAYTQRFTETHTDSDTKKCITETTTLLHEIERLDVEIRRPLTSLERMIFAGLLSEGKEDLIRSKMLNLRADHHEISAKRLEEEVKKLKENIRKNQSNLSRKMGLVGEMTLKQTGKFGRLPGAQWLGFDADLGESIDRQSHSADMLFWQLARDTKKQKSLRSDIEKQQWAALELRVEALGSTSVESDVLLIKEGLTLRPTFRFSDTGEVLHLALRAAENRLKDSPYKDRITNVEWELLRQEWGAALAITIADVPRDRTIADIAQQLDQASTLITSPIISRDDHLAKIAGTAEVKGVHLHNIAAFTDINFPNGLHLPNVGLSEVAKRILQSDYKRQLVLLRVPTPLSYKRINQQGLSPAYMHIFGCYPVTEKDFALRNADGSLSPITLNTDGSIEASSDTLTPTWEQKSELKRQEIHRSFALVPIGAAHELVSGVEKCGAWKYKKIVRILTEESRTLPLAAVLGNGVQQKIDATPEGYTAVLIRIPRAYVPVYSTTKNIYTFTEQPEAVLKPSDVAYARKEDIGEGFLLRYGNGGINKFTATDIADDNNGIDGVAALLPRLEVIDALDRIGEELMMKMGLLSEQMEPLASGHPTEQSVNTTKRLAEQVRTTYLNSGMPSYYQEMHTVIAQLRALDFGVAHSDIESAIFQTLQRLERFESIASGGKLVALCNAIEQQTPNTWAAWWDEEGVIVLGAVLVAVAAASGIGAPIAAALAAKGWIVAGGLGTIAITSVASGACAYVGTEFAKGFSDVHESDFTQHAVGKISNLEYLESAGVQVVHGSLMSFAFGGLGRGLGQWIARSTDKAGASRVFASILRRSERALNKVDDIFDDLPTQNMGFIGRYLSSSISESFEEMVLEKGLEQLGPIGQLALIIKGSKVHVDVAQGGVSAVTTALVVTDNVAHYTQNYPASQRDQLLSVLTESGAKPVQNADGSILVSKTVQEADGSMTVETLYEVSALSEPVMNVLARQIPGTRDSIYNQYQLLEQSDGTLVFANPPGSLPLHRQLRSQGIVVTSVSKDGTELTARFGKDEMTFRIDPLSLVAGEVGPQQLLALKKYLKNHEVNDGIRAKLVAAIVENDPIFDFMTDNSVGLLALQQAVQEAHEKPGAIDEGNPLLNAAKLKPITQVFMDLGFDRRIAVQLATKFTDGGLAGLGSWVKGLVGPKGPQERVSPQIREELGSDERVADFETILDFLEENVEESESRDVEEAKVEAMQLQMEKEGYTDITVKDAYTSRIAKGKSKKTISGKRSYHSSPKQVQELLPFCQHFKDPVRAVKILHRLCDLSASQLSSRSSGFQAILAEPNAEALLQRIGSLSDVRMSSDHKFSEIGTILEVAQSLNDIDIANIKYLLSRSDSDYFLKFSNNSFLISFAKNTKLVELVRRIPQNSKENIIGTLNYLVQYDVQALHDILDIDPDILTGSLSNVSNRISGKEWQKLLKIKSKDRQLVKNMYEHEPTEPTESVVDTVVILSENPHFLAVCNFCKNTNIRGLPKAVEDSHNSRNSNTEDVLRKRMNDEQWMNTIRDPAFVQFLVRLEREFGLTVNFSDIVNDGNIYELWMNKDLMTKIENPQFKKLLLYYVKRIPFTSDDVDVPKGYSVIPKSTEGEPVVSLNDKPAIEFFQGTNFEQEKVWAQLALAQDQYPHLVEDLLFLRDTYGIDYSYYEIQVFLNKGPNFVFIQNDNLAFLGKMQTPKSTAREAVYDEKVKSNYQLLQKQVGYEFSCTDLAKLQDFDSQNNEDDRLALEAAQSLMRVWNQDVLFTVKQVKGYMKAATFFEARSMLDSLAEEPKKAKKAAKLYEALLPIASKRENMLEDICRDHLDHVEIEDLTPKNIQRMQEVGALMNNNGLGHNIPDPVFLLSVDPATKKEMCRRYFEVYTEQFIERAKGELWSELQGMDFESTVNNVVSQIESENKKLEYFIEKFQKLPPALRSLLEDRIHLQSYIEDLGIPRLTIFNNYRELAISGDRLAIEAFIANIQHMKTGMISVGPTDPSILNSPYYEDIITVVYPNHAGSFYNFHSVNNCKDRSADLDHFDIEDVYTFNLGDGIKMKLKDEQETDKNGAERMQEPIYKAMEKLGRPGVEFESKKMKALLDAEIDTALQGISGVEQATTREQKLFVLLLESTTDGIDQQQVRELLIMYHMSEFVDVRGFIEGMRASSEKAKNPEYAYLLKMYEFFADNLKDVSRKICSDATKDGDLDALLPIYYVRKQSQLHDAESTQLRKRLRLNRLGLSGSFVAQISKALQQRTGKKYTPEHAREIIDRYETLRRRWQGIDQAPDDQIVGPAKRSRPVIGQLDAQRRNTERAIVQLSSETGVDLSAINLGDMNLDEYLDAQIALSHGEYDQEQFEQYITYSFQQVFATDLSFIESELSKFEPVKEKVDDEQYEKKNGKKKEKQKKVECFINKNKASAHARGTAGVCVSTDNPMHEDGGKKNIWDMKNYYQLVIRDPKTSICQGMVLFHVHEVKSERVLTASFNPSSTYLYTVDEVQMFKKLQGVLEQFAEANEIDTIAVSRNRNIRTNRISAEDESERAGTFEGAMDSHIRDVGREIHFERPVNFSYRPIPYMIETVDVIWERDSVKSKAVLGLALQAREQGKPEVLVDYISKNSKSIGKQLRLRLTEILLSRDINDEERKRILSVYKNSDGIEGLTSGKGKFSTVEAQLLMDAGICK